MQKHPISHPQMRILNSEMVNQNTPLNNVPVSAFYPLNSHNSLEKALTYLVNTTPDINIRFSLEENGDITQYLGEPKEPLIERYDLRDKTDRDIDLLLDTLSAKPFGNVFDVPMYVFAVIQTRTQTILFVNFYHGICDGSSLNIFMDHLDILYDAANNGQAFFPLHSNTMSYLAVEKNYLSSTACDADKTYFTELLSDLADFPEKINATDSYAANRVNVVLDKSLSKRLKTYLDGFTKPISPFIFMLALSGFYFARFHNTKGSVFCMGYANRVYDEEINGSLGMYVSTVPIKIMAQKQQTFEELMLCAKESMKQSLIHSRYPFDMLLGDLHQQDAEKLLNVAIVSNACKDTLYSRNIGDLKTSIAGITLRVNPFRDDAQGLQTFCFEYKTACYDESTIITMKDGMIALIEEVLNHPDRLCVDIPIVSKSQKQMLLTTFNNTAVNYQDTSASIVLMFKNQAQKTPDNIAVIFEDRQLTYQQIDAITDKLAKKLVASGVKKEDVVGVMIDRSELMVIFPLAVLKAGGAYMPLDYTFPSDRLEYMLADAGVGIILSEGNRPIQHIPNFKGMIISAEDLETMTVAEDVVLPQPEARDKFIILYTSGSTGQPKGCVLEHESLANFCKWYQRYYKITETDRIGAYANFGFDAHMMDLYPLITSGGAVCIIPSGIRLDFILLNEYFEKNRVTVAFMTTQLGRQFVQELDNQSLRALTIGGEKLPSITLPKYDLFHAYGPTECTIFATVRKFKTEHDCLLIGSAIDNYELFVLDADQNLLPMGAVG
ncbi:MAG: AMP-binding protein, partial [Acetobacterium sp.]|nr:AMP-binding protein [Acetobacterium sp.]